MGRLKQNASLFVCALFILTAGLFIAPVANAAPINYGDFSDIPPGSVMYLDVTETANTPGDEEPLYGPPTIVGNQLDFDPAGFAASATDGASDLTDGQLNFTLMGLSGNAIKQISISENGDYSLLGTGTAATQVVYGVGLTTVTVLEVDGVPLAVPVMLQAASASGGDDLGNGIDVLTPWDLNLTYDVDAALNAAGVQFVNGATKLEIALDDSLGAISESSSIAYIAKKGFNIDVDTVPEPGTLMLLASGAALAVLRRKKAR